MAKILYVATSDIHLATFHRPYIKWLAEQGHQVDLSYERRGDNKFEGAADIYELDFPRSIVFNPIIKSYRKLKKIIEKGEYDLVHCHTPIPSMIARLAASKQRKKGCIVIYTAHGFHFFKGGPMKNWLLYYPSEYFLSKFTDVIIVLNHEDYGYVRGRMLHKESFLIPGIGVDKNRFKPKTKEEISQIRSSFGYSDKDFILLYIAEFIPRKNHQFIIEAIPQLAKDIPELKMVFAGKGELEDRMKALCIETNIAHQVDFLGFRTDVEELCSISDIGVSSSRHEGLGLGVIEQMMCKVPVVASRDRGHLEGIKDGINGFIYKQGDTQGFVNKILKLYQNPDKRQKMGVKALEISQNFEVTNTINLMKEIYSKYIPIKD